MLAVLTASLLFGSGLEYGSGQWWRTLYAEGANGPPHPHAAWQLAWSKDGGDEYRITTYRADHEAPSEQLKVFKFKGKTQFTKLSYHANPCNDIWEERGGTVKQFASALLVGHGVEAERPVTVVWRVKDWETHEPVVAIKVFDGDVSQLDGQPRLSILAGGVLVERARVGWLPAEDRPKGVVSGDWLQRTWKYRGEKFEAQTPWRKKARLE